MNKLTELLGLNDFKAIENCVETIDPNCQDESGYTPLMLMIKHKYENLALSLIKKSNRNIQNKDGNTAAMISVMTEHLPGLDSIFESTNCNIQNNDGCSLLMLYVLHYLETLENFDNIILRLKKKLTEMIEKEKNENPKYVKENEDDLLLTSIIVFFSIEKNTLEMIIGQSDCNLKNKKGETALSLAITNKPNFSKIKINPKFLEYLEYFYAEMVNILLKNTKS